MWLVLRFLLRVNLDQNLVLSGAVLAHGLRRGEVQPADTPSSQMGAGTGLRELVLVVVRALSCSQIPSQYPIIAGVLVMSGSAARSFSNLRLAAVWRLSTGSWTPYFSLRATVSRLIRDGPQLSVKPLAERDRPRGREANGVNAEQSTGDRAGLPYPNAVLEAQEPPSLHRALDFSLSVPSLSQPVLHHSFAPPLYRGIRQRWPTE